MLESGIDGNKPSDSLNNTSPLNTDNGDWYFSFHLQSQTKPGWDGPVLGPKMADTNVREFTEEQMAAGKNVHSLQYGSNKGASQAGMNLGKQRMIND